MNFESINTPKPSHTACELAREALDAVTSGRYNSRPEKTRYIEAYRQARVNRNITDPIDSKRLDAEAGLALEYIQQQEDETTTWDMMDQEILEAGAKAAEIRDQHIEDDER